MVTGSAPSPSPTPFQACIQRLFMVWPALFPLSFKTAVLRARLHQNDGKVRAESGVHVCARPRGEDGASEFGGNVVAALHSVLQDKDVVVAERTALFDSVRSQFASRSRAQLRMPWKVEFAGERAIDVRGVRRELVTLLSREVMAKQRGLFRLSQGMAYAPRCVCMHADDRGRCLCCLCLLVHNAKDVPLTGHCGCLSWGCSPSARSAAALDSFRFVGQFISRALSEGLVLDATLSRFVLRRLLGRRPCHYDLQDVDSTLCAQLVRTVPMGD